MRIVVTGVSAWLIVVDPSPNPNLARPKSRTCSASPASRAPERSLSPRSSTTCNRLLEPSRTVSLTARLIAFSQVLVGPGSSPAGRSRPAPPGDPQGRSRVVRRAPAAPGPRRAQAPACAPRALESLCRPWSGFGSKSTTRLPPRSAAYSIACAASPPRPEGPDQQHPGRTVLPRRLRRVEPDRDRCSRRGVPEVGASPGANRAGRGGDHPTELLDRELLDVVAHHSHPSARGRCSKNISCCSPAGRCSWTSPYCSLSAATRRSSSSSPGAPTARPIDA